MRKKVALPDENGNWPKPILGDSAEEINLESPSVSSVSECGIVRHEKVASIPTCPFQVTLGLF